MADKTQGSQTVTIEELCEALSCDIAIELDEEYNDGRSCFAPNDPIYVRVFCRKTYTVKATLGNARIFASGIPQEITEYVDFNNWRGSTEKPIHEITSYNWNGISLGAIRWERGSESLVADESMADGYGVLELTYITAFDRWEYKSPVAGDVIVYAIGTGNCVDSNGDYPSASLTLDIDETCAEEANEVTIVVKDFVTGNVISGASVVIDRNFVGTTDVNGTVYAGLLAGGSHQIRTTAPGYTDSDNDLLGNDEFVVSSS